MGSVEEKDALRWVFLVTVFDATKGSPDESVAMDEIVGSLDITREEAEDILSYLRNEGLAEAKGLGGQIGVTHAGRLAVEDARREPPPSKPVRF